MTTPDKKKTTKLNIETALWNACNSFRGKIDGFRYKDYVLSMLFIKYLCDSKKYDLPQAATFNYLYENRKDPNIGQLINDATKLIENQNSERLKYIFGNVNFNSVDMGIGQDKIATLSNLLDVFNDLDLSIEALENNDLIGDAYMFLLNKIVSESSKYAGEFYTPIEASEVLARIVNPQEGESIYDPTCGSGSLLIRAFQNVKDHSKVEVYGQESNFQTFSMCRMNMFLHQVEKGQIWYGDTITNPQNIENEGLKKFDCIVANPPFSLEKWSSGFNVDGADDKKFKLTSQMDKYNRFEWGVPPRSKGDYAFILHMLSSLKDDGRMAVILPHGVLFRGAKEGEIRKKIIDNNYLEAVIGLPANLFYGTSIGTCILVINKKKPNTDVLFIDSSKEFVAEKKQNKLSEQNINKIVETYNTKSQQDKYSRLVPFEEIVENEYNLNIPRYIDTFEEEEEIDIQQVIKEIKELEIERDKLSAEINVYLKELGIIQ